MTTGCLVVVVPKKAGGEKENIIQSKQSPLSYSHHGATLLATKRTTINKHTMQQVLVIKTRKIYDYYYFYDLLHHNSLAN
jgi:hypothetical protein